MTDTTIAFVHARRVWDSRGRPTLEADARPRLDAPRRTAR